MAEEFDARGYVHAMIRELRKYDDLVERDWKTRAHEFEALNTEARRRMHAVLAKFPAEKRNTQFQINRMKSELESVYVRWGAGVDKIMGLPKIKSRGKPAAQTPVAAGAQEAVQLSLGLRAPAKKDSATPPPGNVFREVTGKIMETVNESLRASFPGQVPTARQQAEALAASVGISNQAYIENISENITRMARTHANELVDRIDSPRPSAGAAGPDGAVSGFHAQGGGAGNQGVIRASHDAHTRSVARDVLVSGYPDAQKFAVADLDTGAVLVLSRAETSLRVVGEQAAGAGPMKSIYPIPLPNDSAAWKDAADITPLQDQIALEKAIEPKQKAKGKNVAPMSKKQKKKQQRRIDDIADDIGEGVE